MVSCLSLYAGTPESETISKWSPFMTHDHTHDHSTGQEHSHPHDHSSHHDHDHSHDHGHSHSHGHDHSHDHDPVKEMTLEQKLNTLFSHWIGHNDSHKDNFLSWAEKARDAGLTEVASSLEQAGSLSQEVTKKLEAALANLSTP